jgi:hypothetical protein
LELESSPVERTSDGLWQPVDGVAGSGELRQ